MGRQSSPRLYIQLAVLTFVAMAVIGVIFSVPHALSIRERAEDDAGAAANASVSASLAEAAGRIDPGSPASSELSSFSANARDLVNERIGRIRLWTDDGRLLASSDDSASPEEPRASALQRASAGQEVAFRVDGPAGDELASYSWLASGLVLAVQQDYGPVAASVTESQRTLSFFAGGTVVVSFLLVQAIVWLVTRGLRSEYHRLLYLYRTGQAVRATLDLSDVMSQLARDATIFIRGTLGIATLRDEDSEDLILQASYEAVTDTSTQHHRPIEEWFLRRCAITGETVTATQDGSPQTSILGSPPAREGPAVILCAPISLRDRTIGVLTVVREAAQGRFTNAEVQLVEEIAGQAAMAVEQAILFAKVRRSATELEMSYDTTLRVLMAALDAKDEVTQGHSERVARLTVAVAKEMGVAQDRLLDIERGALLHDVGKIGVPDQVLQKPNALNDKEWEAMQKHPLLAGLMVSKVDFLEGALPILMYHHERYDGSGYPFGLAGDAIPLEARIFAVVDAYDAITSDRPYRQGTDARTALAEIRQHAGRQFDPTIVEAFLRLMTRNQPALQEEEHAA